MTVKYSLLYVYSLYNSFWWTIWVYEDLSGWHWEWWQDWCYKWRYSWFANIVRILAIPEKSDLAMHSAYHWKDLSSILLSMMQIYQPIPPNWYMLGVSKNALIFGLVVVCFSRKILIWEPMEQTNSFPNLTVRKWTFCSWSWFLSSLLKC